MIAKSMVNTQKQVTYKSSDYADPAKIVGPNAIVYAPPAKRSRQSGPAAPADLDAFAPIIVQGVEAPKDESYPRDSDEIGVPELKTAADGGYAVTINTQKPVLYSSVEKTRVQGADLTQLVYVFWFPRHPVGGVEKGDIDGGVLRITLDAGGRPSVYEYVAACGCWHGVFVGEHVEAWAEKEFSEPIHGKKWFVEKPVENDDDWRVRDIVLGGHTHSRPVVFISAGKHQCLAIQTQAIVRGLDKMETRTYAMNDYDALNHVQVLGGSGKQTASMFNSDGLVWGGQRKGEEKIFSKLDHGGWPRRLDAMKIHWDEEAWNDSDLLDKFLRLPKNMIQADAQATSLQRKTANTGD
jgi:hypothetical protein